MDASLKPQHSKKAKMKQFLEGYSLIAGGLVSGIVKLIKWRKLNNIPKGNTRVISQNALDHFRTSLINKKDDPYSVLIRRNKLPMQLLDDAKNPNTRKVISIDFFLGL